MKRIAKLSAVLLSCLLLVASGAWFASNHPNHPVCAFLKAPTFHLNIGWSFFSNTHGLSGRWKSRDASDPQVTLDVRFGLLTCEVTETLPDGSTKRTLFTDHRNPPSGESIILSDGDRYLMTNGFKKELRLDIPDGPWTPFKDREGRTQYQRKQRTINLVRA